MYKFLKIIPVISLCLFLAQCAEVPAPVVLDPSQLPLFDSTFVGSGITEVPKNVLMEEFSGVRCANCPQGTLKTQEIDQNNPGRVTIMAVHSNFLGAPYEGSQDFRNNQAQELALAPLGPIGGKPSTYINRKIFNSSANIVVQDPNTWENFVNQELSTTTPIDIELENVFLDLANRSFRYRVTLKFAEALNGVNLGFALTESKIIAEQLDGSVKIKDFEHEHVLRSFVGSIYGETLTEEIQSNTVIIKEFELNFDEEEYDPEGLWVLENMELVAYIRNTNQEILNSTHVKLSE